MNFSKVEIKDAVKPTELDRAAVARIRRKNFDALSDEQLAQCHSRMDVAKLCGVIDSAKGASFVCTLIKRRLLVEEKRPEGKYYRKPYHKRQIMDCPPRRKLEVKPETNVALSPTVYITKGEATVKITGLDTNSIAELVKMLGVFNG